MKEDILNSLAAVLGALNSITVSGKANLSNLSGSIGLIEDVYAKIRDVSFAADGGKDKEEK